MPYALGHWEHLAFVVTNSNVCVCVFTHTHQPELISQHFCKGNKGHEILWFIIRNTYLVLFWHRPPKTLGIFQVMRAIKMSLVMWMSFGPLVARRTNFVIRGLRLLVRPPHHPTFGEIGVGEDESMVNGQWFNPLCLWNEASMKGPKRMGFEELLGWETHGDLREQCSRTGHTSSSPFPWTLP